MAGTDITKTERAPMSSLRKTSLVAGVLYLLTFVSIPTLALYGQVKSANSIPVYPIRMSNYFMKRVVLQNIGSLSLRGLCQYVIWSGFRVYYASECRDTPIQKQAEHNTKETIHII